jgi:predicted nucleic acid-binding Zn ribbon protein
VSADPPRPRGPEPEPEPESRSESRSEARPESRSAPEPAEAGPEPAAGTGPDLARAALEAARTSARRRAAQQPRRRVAGRRRRGGYSGAGPDDRDPQRFGAAIKKLVDDRGWSRTANAATVLSGWDRLVGAEIAARCQPVSLVDGELTLAAESTAWATQLRLLAPKLLARIRAELGPDVVTRIRVHGPTAPTWGNGPRRVAGRGPRDTYG